MMQAIEKTIAQYKNIFLGVFGFLFLVILYRTAWLCDDAYISYRTIDNFVNGYGLTYNTDQRVQTFTHPLWLMLHIPFSYFISNAYVVGLLVSMLVTIAAVAILIVKVVKKPMFQLLVIITLFSSKAFMDFSTSGLENPMTHLLLALFALVYRYKEKGKQQLLLLSIISGLALLNRMDSILLFAPALVVVWWPQRSWKTFGWVMLGIVPFIVWELFALTYYGFLFPMSAYSKLNVSLSRGNLLLQGWYYITSIFWKDPLTFIILLLGLIAPFYLKQKKWQPLAIGMFLYVIYTVWIGGDFMLGRFFCAPFFMAIIILSTIEWKIPAWVLPLPFLLGFLSLSHPILSTADYGKEKAVKEHGINDERAFYFQGTGRIAISGWEPEHEFAMRGKKLKADGGDLYITGNMGMLGYYAGPKMHLVDRYAITDPFLAQLPNVYQPNWMPGHNQRIIPPNYVKSLMKQSNQLANKKLRKLYSATQLISRGPIWSGERWHAIFDMNFTRKYSSLVDHTYYALPIKTIRTHAEMNIPILESTAWNSKGNVITTSDAGLKITDLPKHVSTYQLELWMQQSCEFVVVFRKHETILGGNILLVEKKTHALSQFVVSSIPKNTNNIVIYPNTHMHPCGVSKVQLVEK